MPVATETERGKRIRIATYKLGKSPINLFLQMYCITWSGVGFWEILDKIKLISLHNSIAFKYFGSSSSKASPTEAD